jgi:hypothetical protein
MLLGETVAVYCETEDKEAKLHVLLTSAEDINEYTASLFSRLYLQGQRPR